MKMHHVLLLLFSVACNAGSVSISFMVMSEQWPGASIAIALGLSLLSFLTPLLSAVD